MPRGSDARRVFGGGGLIVFVPLFVLFLPLLFHHSPNPVFATFSRPYVELLLVAAVFVLTVSALSGWACVAWRSYLPAGWLLFLVSLLVSASAITEVVLTYQLRTEDAFEQYREWGHRRSLLFGFEAAPNNKWTNAGATYTTDANGFRTHVSDPEWRAKPGRRIFAIGESSVFGYALNDDQTWPHLLEQELRSKLNDPSLDVINAGNNGYNSLQTLFRFYVRVLPFKPDYVILYLGPNDITASEDRIQMSEDIMFNGSVAQFWASQTKGQNFYARTLLFYVLSKMLAANNPLKLGTHLRLSGVAHAADGRDEEEPVMSPQQRETLRIVGATYIRNVRTICLIARANGVIPVLVTFLQNLGTTTDDERFHRWELLRNNALLRQLAADEGISLIDLEAEFAALPQKEEYFYDDKYHPRVKGAQFIATTIAEKWPSPSP